MQGIEPCVGAQHKQAVELGVGGDLLLVDGKAALGLDEPPAAGVVDGKAALGLDEPPAAGVADERLVAPLAPVGPQAPPAHAVAPAH